MVRPMVHSVKHYVQFSLATVTAGTVLNVAIATGVAIDDVNIVSEVKEGSSIKAIYFELWIRSSSTTPSSGQLIVYKKQSDSGNPTAVNMAALGDWDNKRNIFYTTMGLFNDQDADAIALFKGWIKIPKGKQRFTIGDDLNFSIFAPTIDSQICGFATYKEYS